MDWTLILASTAVFVLALLGLSIGVLLGGRPLKGSCGGLAALHAKSRLGDDLSCEFCELDDPNDCPRVKAALAEKAKGGAGPPPEVPHGR